MCWNGAMSFGLEPFGCHRSFFLHLMILSKDNGVLEVFIDAVIIFFKGKIVIYRLYCLEFFLLSISFSFGILSSAKRQSKPCEVAWFSSRGSEFVLCFLFCWCCFLSFSDSFSVSIDFPTILLHDGRPTLDWWQQLVPLLACVPVLPSQPQVLDPAHGHRSGYLGSCPQPN